MPDAIPFLIVALIVAVGAPLLIWAVRAEQARDRRRQEAWSRWAGAHGFERVPYSGPWYRRQGERVRGTVEGLEFELFLHVVSTGETSVNYTKLRARGLPGEHPKLKLGARGFATSCGRFFGLSYVECGDGEFDRRFAVRAGSREDMLEQLPEAARAALLSLGKRPYLNIAQGTAELYWIGAESDPAVLERALAVIGALAPGRGR